MSDFDIVKNYSLRLLSFRPRSESELKFKLKAYIAKKHFADDLIANVISNLKELKFIDDFEFSRWWIDQRNRSSIRGNHLIRYELKNKGISKEIINDLLSQSDKNLEFEKADLLIKKQISKLPKMFDSGKTKTKFYNFLFRRGFSSELIYKVIDENFKNDRID